MLQKAAVPQSGIIAMPICMMVCIISQKCRNFTMLILQVSTLEQKKNCGIPTAKNCIGWIRTTDGCIWTSGKVFSIHWERWMTYSKVL